MIRAKDAEKYRSGTASTVKKAGYSSLVFNISTKTESALRIIRYPWEGFLDLGFRFALSIYRGEQ